MFKCQKNDGDSVSRLKYVITRPEIVATTLSAVVGVAVLWALHKSASAQAPPRPPVVDALVHDALAMNPDGRAYVVIVLDSSGIASVPDAAERALRIQDRQQAVLATLEPQEFQLVHRPDSVAAFTGHIGGAGLAKVAAHSLVTGVGLDAMNYLYRVPNADDALRGALETTSQFVVSEVVPRMVSAPAGPDAEEPQASAPATPNEEGAAASGTDTDERAVAQVSAPPAQGGNDGRVAAALPDFYYYNGERVHLELEASRIAVRYTDEMPAAARLATVTQAGIDATVTEPTGLVRSYLITLGAPMADAADADARVRALLQSPDVEFASPIFQGLDGGWVTITPDVLMQFNPGHAANADAILQAVVPDLRIVSRSLGTIDGGYQLRGDSRNGFEILASANRLAEDPRVTWAEPDMLFSGRGSQVVPNDPLYSQLWGIDNTGQFGGVPDMDMDGDHAWTITTGDPNILVLIIDTGVQQNHPDLNQLPGADFTGQGGGGGPMNQCDNHGTAVAGCVSSVINNSLGTVGIAPTCRILSARPFTSVIATPCTGNWTTMAAWTVNALAWGQQQGAQVSNNSNFYGFTSNAINAQYAASYTAGMVHFAIAGNFARSTIEYPGSLPQVNAVAALTPQGQLASFSSWGTGLAFSAPGQQIWTTDRTGAAGYNSTDYALVQGTSFSSPYAAGVAALILSQDPNRTPPDVEAIMQCSARDLGVTGYDTIFGWGFVNAFDALSTPTLINVMDGIGAEFPAGAADTFISPHGDWIPTSPFDCDFTEFEITVNVPVTMTGYSVVFTGNPSDKPIVTTLQDNGGGSHTVLLDRPLVAGHWAKITLSVQSVATGCDGTLEMWVAQHPDDINQDGTVNIADATAFGNEYNGQGRHVLVDLNCDGAVNVSDATAFGSQWYGTGDATQAWQGHTLPAKP